MNATFYYTPKTLEVGEFKEAFQRAVADLVGSDARIEVLHPRQLREGLEDETSLDAESLRRVVDLSKIDLTLFAHAGQLQRMNIICWGDSEAIGMRGIGSTSVQCLERMALSLGLEPTTPPKKPLVRSIEQLESRLAVLEKATASVARGLKCFVSFKFDRAQMAPIERLKRFLLALGIELVTGEEFEPRRIEDKVKARLRADVDFVVAVVSGGGASNWIRDELGEANARGLWVILLLDSSMTFDKGIFGTLEYITYDVAIDQAFLQLLEGINFIRASSQAN